MIITIELHHLTRGSSSGRSLPALPASRLGWPCNIPLDATTNTESVGGRGMELLKMRPQAAVNMMGLTRHHGSSAF
jgi:hypothetical protein